MLWIPINQTVYHDIIPQNNPHSFTCASIPSRPSTINKVTRNKEICEGRGFPHCVFWKNVNTQKCAKEQCSSGGCWSVFCWWDVVLFFLGVVFSCWGDSGWSGFRCFFIGVFFSVEGRKPKNVCFKKDLHLDATFVFFRALNKEQATTESHAWECRDALLGRKLWDCWMLQGQGGRSFNSFWEGYPKWFLSVGWGFPNHFPMKRNDGNHPFHPFTPLNLNMAPENGAPLEIWGFRSWKSSEIFRWTTCSTLGVCASLFVLRQVAYLKKDVCTHYIKGFLLIKERWPSIKKISLVPQTPPNIAHVKSSFILCSSFATGTIRTAQLR